MRRLLFATSLLVTGFLVGLVISGRTAPMSTSNIAAAPRMEQGRSATVAANVDSALPDLSDVAERAVQASVNISSTQYERVNPFFQRYYRNGVQIGRAHV